jgi:CRP/FNR family cyclic AMP-dependent transcriptional regulator
MWKEFTGRSTDKPTRNSLGANYGIAEVTLANGREVGESSGLQSKKLDKEMIQDPNVLRMMLGKMKLFQDFSDDELRTVLQYGECLEVAQSQVIIKEGDAEPGLYVLVSGEMEVLLSEGHKFRNRPSSLHLCKLEVGDYVGEYSLIDHEPASACVVAKEPCLIFSIPCIEFDKMIASNDVIAAKVYRNMLQLLVARARKYDEELDLVL